jgi:hypothetical protein
MMTSTDRGGTPAIQPVGPALFAPLTTDENRILRDHLNSGWSKQAAVYPALSEPWQETSALLNDLHAAYEAAIEDQYGPADAAMTEPPATELELEAET